MPLIPIDQALENITAEQNAVVPGVPDNTQTEVSAARSITSSFKYNNYMYNLWNSNFMKGIDPVDYNYIEQGYDFKNGVVGSKYEQYIDQFANTTNTQQQRDLMTQIDNEEKWKTDIAQSSGLDQLTGSILAGVADPLILVPGFAVAKGARIASILKTAASGAALVGGATALQEGALQSTQATRTLEESAYSIGASAVLGGLVGGGAGAFFNSYRPHSTLSKIFKDANDFAIPEQPRSASAAQSTVINEKNYPSFVSEEFALKNPRAAEIINKATIASTNIPGLKPASLEGLTSSSAFVRQATSDLVDIPLQLRSHLTDAQGVPMELKNLQDDIRINRIVSGLDDNYKSYVNRTKATQDNSYVMKRKEFDQAAFKAFNRGDESDIPEAAAAARALRAEIKKANAELIKWGRLTKEDADLINNGDLTRVWNRKVVNERAPELRKILIENALERNRIKIAEARAANVGQKEAKVPVPEKMSYDEAVQKANEAIDNILALEPGESAMSNVIKTSVERGVRFTKERTIDVPNAAVEDFLVQDFTAVGYDYLRKANQMTRFYEFLDKAGAEKIDDLFTKLKQEYDQKLTSVLGDAKAEAALRKDLQKNQKLLDQMIKLSLGQLGGKSSSLTRTLRNFNYITLLGWMPISSISDLAMPVFRHGLGKTFGSFFGGIPKILSSSSLRKLAKEELEDLGVVMEVQNNAAIKAIYNPDFNDNIVTNVVESYGNWAADKFTKATGMAHWNAFGKANAVLMSEAKFSRMIKGFDKLSESDRAFLNQHFIGKEDIASIQDQLSKHGIQEGNTTFLQLNKWTNKDAAEKVRAAILKEVRSTIITPGRGDIPLAVHNSELAKIMFQFKNFFSATTGRVTLSALQRRDMNTAMGIMAMIATGAMTYVIKQVAQGKEVDFSPTNLLAEGINRSGFLGMISDPVFSMILQPLTGKQTSRYQAMSGMDALLGPSYALAKTLLGLGYDFKSGEVDSNTWKQVRRLVPFLNLWYIDILLRKAGLREAK